MNYLASFFGFWKDLLIGDDWTIAAGVVVALVGSAILAHAAVVPWLVLPLAVATVLTLSLRHAA